MYNPPSTNPADLSTLVGLLSASFRKQMEELDGAIPASVIKMDETRGYVQVQLQIKILGTTGQSYSERQIAKVKAQMFGGGGFIMSFPYKEGDKGWVIAGDRDTSLYFQTGAEAPPNTSRIKSFSDGVFIPDNLLEVMFASEDMANFVLQSLDGTIKLTMGTEAITLKFQDNSIVLNGVNTTITGPVIINDDLTVNGIVTATEGLNLSGGTGNTAVLTGNLFVTGNIAATGTITPMVPPLLLHTRSPAL